MNTVEIWNDPEHREASRNEPLLRHEIGKPIEVRNDTRFGMPYMTVGRRFKSIVDCDHDNAWMYKADLYVAKTQLWSRRVEVSGFLDSWAMYDDHALSKVYEDAAGTDCGYECHCGYTERYVPPTVPGLAGKFVVISLEIS